MMASQPNLNPASVATHASRDSPPSTPRTTDSPTGQSPEDSSYTRDQEMSTPSDNYTSNDAPPPQLQPGRAISTFVIYTPKDIESPLDHPTGTTAALRQEDVHILENEFPNGGTLSSVHSPDEAVLWVEAHYADPLVTSIRSHGIGGPIASMLSPGIPALAIFGSFLEKSVVEAAQLLADGSKFMVMLRPTTDDPVPKWGRHAAGYPTFRDDRTEPQDGSPIDPDLEETIDRDDISTDTTEVSCRDSNGVLRLRGGADDDTYTPWLGPIHQSSLNVIVRPAVGIEHHVWLMSRIQVLIILLLLLPPHLTVSQCDVVQSPKRVHRLRPTGSSTTARFLDTIFGEIRVPRDSRRSFL
ncbi:hypothetical protein C8J57DRAFT_178042 [Mycena rebaudengoi]|nr:hypothetical protein C8J57DRAFT_178042 [Mycena rebaudengoi]